MYLRNSWVNGCGQILGGFLTLVALVGCTAFQSGAGQGDADEIVHFEHPCWVIARGMDGELEAIRIRSSGAIDRNANIEWQSPEKLVALQCERPSIVPRVTDVQYLMGGVPLFIRSASDNRIGLLEMHSGQAVYGLVNGDASVSESDAIKDVLNRMQQRVQSENRSD